MKKLNAGGFDFTCVMYLILISLPDFDDGGLFLVEDVNVYSLLAEVFVLDCEHQVVSLVAVIAPDLECRCQRLLVFRGEIG